MVKTLRSFIHEKIPLELRVELDLLSRRRDLRGEEKQEEVIDLLRNYNVGDVVQLGPGTNRYGLKLDGFVLKVATDHDGKVDNLKEFKMAKVMFPKVPKTYEVSENGSLLVAEYVIPFGSYTEMMRYADQIREILTEFSSVFLIGDVGLTGKNYANWGLRVGTEEVVCLDFAYVYDASSDLFICRHCNANAMLVPNRDFTKLVCPNKACQKETLFEDIKSMISNDFHMKQIGDLSKEGYVMETSGVVTELTEAKSNYLVKRRKKMKPRSKINEPEEESKELVNNETIKKEDIEMFKNEVVINSMPTKIKHPFSGLVVKGLSVSSPDQTTAFDEFDGDEVDFFTDDSDDVDSGFQAEVDPNATVDLGNAEDAVPEYAECNYVDIDAEDVQIAKYADEEDEELIDTVEPGEEINAPQTQEVTVTAEPHVDPHESFTEKFCRDSHRAVSNICNSMAEAVHIQELFDDVKNDLGNKKMYAGQFYTEVGNAMFRSMVSYLKFDATQVPNPVNAGTHTEYLADFNTVNSDEYGEDRKSALRTIERFFNTRVVNSQENFIKSSEVYEGLYGRLAFPEEWIALCADRLRSKIQISSNGVSTFVDALYTLCGPVFDDNDDVDEESEDDEEDAIDIDPENVHLTVEIFQDDDFDIIKLKSGDAFGNNDIPLYVNLDSVSAARTFDGMVDPRNGIYDWLAHMVPDVMFKTKDPEKYIIYNNTELEEMQGRVVILGKNSEGYTIVGIFMLAGVYVVDDDFNYIPMFQEEILAKINRAICDAIGHTAVSHLKRSIGITDLIHDEEYASQFFIPGSNAYEESEDDEEDDQDAEDADDNDEEEFINADNAESNCNDAVSSSPAIDAAVTAITEAEEAAVAAMMESNPPASPNNNGVITPTRRRK